MKALLQTQWVEFQDSIAAMDDNSSARQILNVILSWLRQYPQVFLNHPYSDYAFDRFGSLVEADCPVERSPMHGAEFVAFKRIIANTRVRDAESIARYLRDTLETLVLLEVDRQCPRCQNCIMHVYKNRYDGRTAFQCRQCGFAHYLDGSRVGANELTFAFNEDLHRAELI